MFLQLLILTQTINDYIYLKSMCPGIGSKIRSRLRRSIQGLFKHLLYGLVLILSGELVNGAAYAEEENVL